VATLAQRAGLSQRTFFRKFTETMGETPAHLIESLRLDAARVLLAQGLSIKVTAARVGLSGTTFARAFERRFGVPARSYRQTSR
jgi:transcriptional regulator GlxA family with amidase domain